MVYLVLWNLPVLHAAKLTKSICRLQVCPSVMPITHLRLSTSTYQLPNIINPSSSYFKFVTTSECGDQIPFCSRLKTKKWRKLEQHSIENHSHMAQWVEQLTCIQEVAGLNPAGELWKSILFACTLLKFSFDNTVTWHSKHASKRDLSEIKRTSSGNSTMVIAKW